MTAIKYFHTQRTSANREDRAGLLALGSARFMVMTEEH